MRSRLLPAILLTLVFSFVSCSRDPQVVKKRYYESGNTYFEKGLYKQASIQYRNALKQDPKFGEARLKLAEMYDQLGDARGALAEYVRADLTHGERVLDALAQLAQLAYFTRRMARRRFMRGHA